MLLLADRIRKRLRRPSHAVRQDRNLLTQLPVFRFQFGDSFLQDNHFARARVISFGNHNQTSLEPLKESGDTDWSRDGISPDLLPETRSSAHSVSRTRTPDDFPEGILLTNCCSTTRNQYLPKRLRSLFAKR